MISCRRRTHVDWGPVEPVATALPAEFEAELEARRRRRNPYHHRPPEHGTRDAHAGVAFRHLLRIGLLRPHGAPSPSRGTQRKFTIAVPQPPPCTHNFDPGKSLGAISVSETII